MEHSHYNRRDFPLFLLNHGNWDICANLSGYCAAVARSDRPGSRSSHFGDIGYTYCTIRNRNVKRRFAAAMRRAGVES